MSAEPKEKDRLESHLRTLHLPVFRQSYADLARQAERETLKAVELARNPWELSVARKQLQEIRKANRESTRNFEWHGSLLRAVVVFGAMAAALMAAFVWL